MRRIHGDERRGEIVAAGCVIVLQRGWRAVTVRDVATSAACSESLVRVYFQNRRRLCRAIAVALRQQPGTSKIIEAAASLGLLK